MNFLVEEFPNKGELSQDSNFYELDESTPSYLLEQEDSEPMHPRSSGSCTPVDDVVTPSQKSLTLHRSNLILSLVVALRLRGKCAWWY